MEKKDIKHNEELDGKFTKEKQWKYNGITKKITSKLQDALILFKLKTGNNANPETKQLVYDENWEIYFNNRANTPKKGAVDVLGKIEDINVFSVQKELNGIINKGTYIENYEVKDIPQIDKDKLKESIKKFIQKNFLSARSKLESKKNLLHKTIRNKAEELSTERARNDYKKIIKKKKEDKYAGLDEDAINQKENLIIEQIKAEHFKEIEDKTILNQEEYIKIIEGLKMNYDINEYLDSEKNRYYKDKILYRDIYLAITNILYSKNQQDYIEPNGEISEEGLKQIGSIFLKAIKNIPNSGSSKGFHKIFHDGDFNFLRKEDSNGNPIIGTTNHYVKAIMYLMKSDAFNAYGEGGTEGDNERYKSRKSFLNNLYTVASLEEDEKKENGSDKGIIHRKLGGLRTESVKYLGDDKSREASDRLKTDASKILKAGSRTHDIKDESGVRANYFGDLEDKKKIRDSIISICQEYLKKIKELKGIKIKSITIAKKGNFITNENENIIYKELEDLLETFNNEISLSKRVGKDKKESSLESLCSKYKHHNKCKNVPKELQEAYTISNGITRGSNGDYKDFKLIIEYEINKEEFNNNLRDTNQQIQNDTNLFQEISFYPNTNDIGIGNHNFLDLEKRIFNRVKNMNDGDLGKSISLNRLRYFTEATIKDISFEIDKYNDKIKRGILIQPKNDDYKYLSLDGQKISLEGLIFRNEGNTKRFDILIPMIINYFIKHNKIFYINKEDSLYQGLVTSEQLYDKGSYKKRRFSTCDVLRNIALDAKNENDYICFYTEGKSEYPKNFFNVNLGDLGNFIGLESF